MAYRKRCDLCGAYYYRNSYNNYCSGECMYKAIRKKGSNPNGSTSPYDVAKIIAKHQK